MSFVKHVMLGFVLMSFITFGILSVVGSMNANYGQDMQVDDNTQNYLNNVQDVTASLESGLQPDKISESTGLSGLFDRIVAGGSLTANVFSAMFIKMPLLMNQGISVALAPLGLQWAAIFIQIAAGVIFIIAFVKFVLGREP